MADRASGTHRKRTQSRIGSRMEVAFPKPGSIAKRKRRNHVRKNITKERRVVELRCDYLVKQLVHARDENRCLKCGSDGDVQAAHILPKGKYPLMRFVLENLLSLCYTCHLHWAHKDPIGFTEWLDAKWPGRKQMLIESARMPRKVDMLELLIVLEDEVKRLQLAEAGVQGVGR